MLMLNKRIVAIYVDKTNQQWIARDAEGKLWLIPVAEDAWKQRVPFTPTEKTELEPVPGHYKSLLGLPF
ncbi:MAG: hypothetical protein R3C12_18355 [Planctomycetaceae bacterium]|nr:hypothetical protein [Planctomycetaceae bacterium]